MTSTLCYREASKYLLEVLESVSDTDLNDVIERILDAVEKQPCKATNWFTFDKITCCCIVITVNVTVAISDSIELFGCISLTMSSFLSILQHD